MNAYRTSWQILCGVLAILGVGTAFIWTASAMLVLFAFAALVAGAATSTICLDPTQAKAPKGATRLVLRNAFLGGTAAASIVGYGALLGAGTFLLLFAVAGSSPYALGLYRRTALRLGWVTPPTPPGNTVRELLPATDSRPADLTPATHAMDDVQLCQAWRSSFAALQNTQSIPVRLGIVEARRGYLDEFERRNPAGLTAWLASGARAASNPQQFLVGSSGTGRSTIDWDDLIHGE